MTKKSRLFLFASFDQDGFIDDALVYYLSRLSKCGDIVFIMDNECPKSEIEKIKPFVIFASAKRHGEYDFGSYKRGYQYALKQNIINNYDYVYFVNDSVYGPVGGQNIEKALLKIENSKCDFIGMLSNEDKNISKHIQSWFVGFTKKIFLNKSFQEFITSVTKQPSKWKIIVKYEIGLSELVKSLTNNKMYVLLEQHQGKCNTIYRKPWVVIDSGIPFLKKIAIKKSFSYKFIEKLLNNKILSDEIKRRNPKIEFRPFQYFCFCIFKR